MCRQEVASTDAGKLREDGLCPVAREVDEKFEYGDGEILPAKTSYLYPVGITGKNVLWTLRKLRRRKLLH